MKLIAIGDNVADTYIQQKIYFPGGNCVNVAVDAKRAGATTAAYLGIFGNDDRATHINESLKQEQVELVNCRKAYAPTAQPRVVINDGEREFQAGPKNSVQHLLALQLTPDDFAEIKKFDVVHTGIYASLENYLSDLHDVTKVAFDFSDCRKEHYLKQVLPNINYAFFSGADLSDQEAEAFAKSCLTLGPEVIVITRGSNSAFLLNAESGYYQPAQSITVTDTMGAGDSFIAGFLVSYLDEPDLCKAAVAASKSAAATCKISGGFGHQKSF
ncbi:PfkB family carbohydrate kinase [Lactobacillus sp. ESL0684]|uniref:PfkB family carbohydrate kinase n=1 Tax=Lactobacillus sp. ESL0684 TaxID=2983213 RepID=UPI0023F7968C|nr:PfkB family carbohydrate kinase [Lactobacillus sp. ESL0684]WEV43216.1 PfkB family carbohydrate kinase [Lactobacillus sp. ESL0684]